MIEILAKLSIPITGAIIGYITNWLAIKMLFRPYHEKKIFGITLPFTPGLIPKRRLVLAEKVGETVGEHLLTDDVLKQAINSEKVKADIDKSVDDFIDKTLDKDYSIDDILTLVLKEKKLDAIEKTESKILYWFKDFYTTNTIEDKIKNELFKKFVLFLKSKSIGDISNKTKDFILEQLDLYIEKYFDIEKVKSFLNSKTDDFLIDFKNKDLLLKDIIPEDITNNSISFIKKSLPKIPEIIEGFLSNNPNIEAKVKELIFNLIDENANIILLIFINKESVYKNIKNGLIDYFKSEENLISFSSKIDNLLETISEKKANELIEKIGDTTIYKYKSKAIDLIVDNINETNILKASEFVNDKLDSYKDIVLYDFILGILPDFEVDVKNFLNDNTTPFLNMLAKESSNYYKIIKEHFLNFKINIVLNKIDDKKKILYKEKLHKVLNITIEKISDYIVKNMDIEQIVEDKINEFTVEEVEELVFSVVDKELNAITALGGVLGFIIGTFSMFI